MAKGKKKVRRASASKKNGAQKILDSPYWQKMNKRGNFLSR